MAEERSRYVAHLAECGVRRPALRSRCRYLLAGAERLHLADRPHELIAHAEIKRESVRWMKIRPHGSQSKCTDNSRICFVRYVTQWLQFLGRLQPRTVAPRRFGDQIAAFAEYRKQERGLAQWTIRSECSRLKKFFERLGAKAQTLEGITIAQIDKIFIEQLTQAGFARTTIATLAYSLRVFFTYAEGRGWCRRGLAAGIKAPRVYDQESLPAGPTWDQLQQVLATTEGDRPADVRDRAILMLLAIYGLRTGEVLHLRLDDIDWERELLTVRRSKTPRTQSFPLSRQVGNAILRYLKEVRPRSRFREVFLTVGAPFRPLRSNLWRLVAPRLTALGLALPHYGPHSLRHACATHLLAQGFSLKEIGDHLGHLHSDSTRIYAKVDLIGLRQVADFDLGGVL